jgi:lipopolysaccharide export system protein LptC
MIINKKKIILLSILVIAIAFSFWIIHTSRSIKPAKSQPHTPDAFMENISAVQIDKFGKPINTFTATKVLNYKQENKSNFDNPFIVHYVPNAPPWHISAKYGQSLDNNQTIILTVNVKVHQLPGPNSHNTTLTTSKLTYYPKKAFVITHQPVTITQPGSIVHAIGLTADLNKSVIKLMSKVHGQYGKIGDKSHEKKP